MIQDLRIRQNPSVDKSTSPLKKGRSLKTPDEKIKKISGILRKRHWYIGVMESCTGGAIANCITNIPGVSDVFKEGKVTYCNEAKIKAGVSEEIIKKYGVYSKQTAEEMAKKIEGEVGIGVTGNFNLPREVFIAVRIKEKIVSEKLLVKSDFLDGVKARKEMKMMVIEKTVEIIIDSL